jgi:hypothetical protein
MKSTDTVVLASCTTSGGCTITLPGVADTNQVLYVKKVDGSTEPVKVVTAVSTDLIESTNTAWLQSRSAAIQLQSDGGTWQSLATIPNIPPYLGYTMDSSSAQAVATSSNINYVAFYNPTPVTIYAFRVWCATASGTVEFGVYDSDPYTGKPNNKLISTSTGTLATGATTFNLTAGYNLPPGNYWAAVLLSNTISSITKFGNNSIVGNLVQTGTSATLPATAGTVSGTAARSYALAILVRHSVNGT